MAGLPILRAATGGRPYNILLGSSLSGLGIHPFRYFQGFWFLKDLQNDTKNESPKSRKIWQFWQRWSEEVFE
jgi:hypothetical protein